MSQKARVFISCGQRKDSEEIIIAKQIAKKLCAMGYEPYVATEVQSLKGVKENIFRMLETSEYFLFIDFKRERLFKENKDTGEHRGSLFSHQELAIATFRGYDVLAFQEDGVKKEDGILRFVQTNCIPFSDRRHLPSIIAEKIREYKWNPTWKNELTLQRDENDFQDARAPQRGLGRYYHIKVFNNHNDKIARNCIAYIWRIKNLETGETRVLELVELKWKGVKREAVAIAPKSFRFLDAFHINNSNPTLVHLGLNYFLIDWTGYLQEYQISGPGDYELDYVVYSEDFSPTSAKVRLHVGTQIPDVRFEILNI